jgi:hypothetical protein
VLPDEGGSRDVAALDVAALDVAAGGGAVLMRIAGALVRGGGSLSARGGKLVRIALAVDPGELTKRAGGLRFELVCPPWSSSPLPFSSDIATSTVAHALDQGEATRGARNSPRRRSAAYAPPP